MMAGSNKRAASSISATPPRKTRSATSAEQQASAHVNTAKVSRRSVRTNGPITCCDFGLDRVEKYRNADFCHPCKLWDENLGGRASRNSERFRCQRTHQSLTSPQLRSSKWFMRNKEPINAANEEPMEEHRSQGRKANSPRRRSNNKFYGSCYYWSKLQACRMEKAADMEKLTAEVEMLKARLAKADAAKSKYHTDLKKTKRLLSKFEIRMEKLLAKKKNEKPVSVIEGIHSALDQLISSYYSKFHLKTLLKDICDAFWTWRSGATQDTLLEKSRSHFREHVFSPLKIC